MDQCDILISESQERMLIVANIQNVKEINEIFNKWDLESVTIGNITLDGKYSVYNSDDLLYTEKMANMKDITQTWTMEGTCPISSCKKLRNMDLWKVYDSTVGNRTIKGPDKPESYAVLSIPENGKTLVVTWGSNFYICHNKMLEVGGTAHCIVNCLNYGHPKDSLGALAGMVETLSKECKRHHIPVVGGNVSLYNSTDDKSISPTPVLLMVGFL